MQAISKAKKIQFPIQTPRKSQPQPSDLQMQTQISASL